MILMSHPFRLALICILLLPLAEASAKKLMEINTAYSAMPMTSSTQNQPGTEGIVDQLVITMFADIGMEAEVQGRHGEKALRFANSGIADGDAGRILGLDKKYRNLVRVEEILITTDISAFTTENLFEVDSWKSLVGRNVGIPAGWKILEKNIPHALRFKDTIDLFSALKDGIIDVAVIEQTTGQYNAKQVGIERLEALKPALVRIDLFLYLHKKHRELLPKLQKTLKTIKDDGRYAEILKLSE